MEKMKHPRAIILFILLSLPAVSTLSLCAANEPDYINHPVYAKYQFGGRDTKVLNLGTQPLAVPEGLIGAALSHDRLLRVALKERNWELRSHSFLKGVDSNFFFQRGDLDAALTGIWPTLTLASVKDIQVIGLAEQGFVSLITKGHFRQIVDLKGKRIGVPSGSTAHYSLLIALETAGMKESDVNVVPLDVSEMMEALAQGKVDAFATWEPFSTNALQMNPEFSVVQRFLTYDYYYLSADLVRQNPEIADLLAAAYVRSLRWMTADRKNLSQAITWVQRDGSQMLGKPPGASTAEMTGIAAGSLSRIASSPMVLSRHLAEKGSIRQAFAFLQSQGKISGTVPWKKIENSFDRTLLEKILSDPAKHQILTFDYDE